MTSAGTRSCVVWTSCEAEPIRPSTAAEEKPAEVTKGGWIHESQQGFLRFNAWASSVAGNRCSACRSFARPRASSASPCRL